MRTSLRMLGMGWKTGKLGDVLLLKRGYDLPNRVRQSGSVPVVSSSGITGFHNVARVKAPGVVTGRYGTLGEVFYITEDFWPLNTSLYVQDFKGNNPRWVYYFLKQVLGRPISDKAAVPGVNRNDLHARRVRYPDLSIQERIVDRLSAYDDLIENNRRRIQLLEQAARLLYKEWFVHFRFPACAASVAAGRPGHEHVKIKNGLPEGWEMVQVKDILAKVKRPRKVKKEEYLKDGPIPCVDQSREFIGGYTDDQETVIDIGKPVIVFGDHTRILKFIDFPFACGADGTQLIVSNDNEISQEYLYFSLDAIDLSNYFYARHFKFLKDQHIPRPRGSLILQFTAIGRPIMQQIKTLREQIYHLGKARDLLLPRLMNGEIVI